MSVSQPRPEVEASLREGSSCPSGVRSQPPTRSKTSRHTQTPTRDPVAERAGTGSRWGTLRVPVGHRRRARCDAVGGGATDAAPETRGGLLARSVELLGEEVHKQPVVPSDPVGVTLVAAHVPNRPEAHR